MMRTCARRLALRSWGGGGVRTFRPPCCQQSVGACPGGGQWASGQWAFFRQPIASFAAKSECTAARARLAGADSDSGGPKATERGWGKQAELARPRGVAEVRAGAGNSSHSNRSATLSSCYLTLSFGHVARPCALRSYPEESAELPDASHNSL